MTTSSADAPSRARALVVHPPVTVARDWIDYPYFADLGAVSLAAALRERAHTSLVNAYALGSSTLHWRRDGRGHLGASVHETLTAIEAAGDQDAIVVVITPFHRPPARDDVLAAILRGVRAIHPERCLMLADAYQSGQHYVETDAVLEAYPEADAWVKYEAEITVPELVEAGEARGVHRGDRPRLDDLPLPAWDLVDLAARDRFSDRVVAASGRSTWQFPIDGRTLPAITSRGCPFVCAHCSSNPDVRAGEPKTQRRLTDPAPLLEALVRQHGASRVAVLDELVNVRRSHFDRVLDCVEALDVRVEVPNGFRADYLHEADLARLKGRITTVSVSAESGSQRVLDEVVDKRLDLADIDRVAEAAHRQGVALLVHWMIGLPTETREDVLETLTRAQQLYARFGAWPAVQFATPLPGTRLADGRSLPVVTDWGPCFQTLPTQPGARVSREELLALRDTHVARVREIFPAPPPFKIAVGDR